ncbi:hypothetical protein Gogos_008840, partial [Gossypium gossypioides]|nr:hypothetical protein [Gossypium gossypioides]
EWVNANLQDCHDFSLDDVDWNYLFGIIRWFIWKNRNLFIFQGTSGSGSDIIKASYTLPCKNFVGNWVCLYTDGSINHAAAGGIVRNRYGEWIFGFNKHLSSSSVFYAKLWVILYGLTILINRGYDNVLIQSNSLEAVKDLQDSPLEGSNSALTRRIQQMLSRFSRWSIIYISREDNQDVDKLVKMVHKSRHGVQLFEDLPFGGRV